MKPENSGLSISIIVPVYNVVNYLDGCIDSILQQQGTADLEILLVDDGSTDGGGARCDALAGAHHNIKAVHRKNGGLGAARNTGLEHATKEWILFLDSDDFLLPNALTGIARQLAAHKDAQVLIGQYLEYDEDEKAFAEPPFNKIEAGDKPFGLEDVVRLYYESGSWSVWKLVLNAAFVAENGFRFEESIRHGEDVYWDMNLFSRATNVYLVPVQLVAYRLNRKDSLSNNHVAMMNGAAQTHQALLKGSLPPFVQQTTAALFAAWALLAAKTAKGQKAGQWRALVSQNKPVLRTARVFDLDAGLAKKARLLSFLPAAFSLVLLRTLEKLRNH